MQARSEEAILKYEDLPEAMRPYWDIDLCDEARLLGVLLGHRVLSNTIWTSGHEYILAQSHMAIITGCSFYLGREKVARNWLTREKVHDPAAGSGHS